MKEDEERQEPEIQTTEMSQLAYESLADDQVAEGHRSGFVAVIGRPNVGKSTLMNALIGQKLAIVSPRPQTTRRRQLGILTEQEFQIIFVDTPGMVKPRQLLDEFMVDEIDETFRDADLILWLAEGLYPPGGADSIIAERIRSIAERKPAIVALNKCDLLDSSQVGERSSEYGQLLPSAKLVAISALEGDGLEELLALLVEHLPEGPRYFPSDQTSDSLVRDIAAEMVREQIYLQLREELPYGTAVQIDEFKVRDDGSNYIRATIYAERESHKRIIVGSKGTQLREIGSAARQEIEAMTEAKVFLDLWVKVEPNWRRKRRSLERFGYK